MAAVDRAREERRRQQAVAAGVLAHRGLPVGRRADAHLDARLVDGGDDNVQVGQVVPAHHLEHRHDARGRVVPVEEDGAVVLHVQPPALHLDALAVHRAVVKAGLDAHLEHSLVDALERVEHVLGHRLPVPVAVQRERGIGDDLGVRSLRRGVGRHPGSRAAPSAARLLCRLAEHEVLLARRVQLQLQLVVLPDRSTELRLQLEVGRLHLAVRHLGIALGEVAVVAHAQQDEQERRHEHEGRRGPHGVARARLATIRWVR